MPKGSKFDPNSAFNSIIGNSKGEVEENKPQKRKNQERVQKAYYLDKDLFNDLRMKALKEDKPLTEIVNKAIRIGLDNWDKQSIKL